MVSKKSIMPMDETLLLTEDTLLWSTQKEKHGLSRRDNATISEALIGQYRQQRQEALTQFVQDFIHRKECINYVPKKDPKRKPDDPVKCHCGEVAEKHIKGSAGVVEFFQEDAIRGLQAVGRDDNHLSNLEPVSQDKAAGGQLSPSKQGKTEWKEWRPETSIREFTTNGFGKIVFNNEGLGGHKPAKFIRLADNTPPEMVLDLMLDHWRMFHPRPAHLVITVIGGAKNFKLDGKKKVVFNRGLVNAASTTNAWIITGGCNMGVMKAVGEAVAEGQSYTWDRMGMTHSLRCIGIAPWGYVERRERLVSKDGSGSWNATYKVSNVIRHGHPVSLNHDHTHFLLVDDGNRGRYGGVADFRAALERQISLPKDPGDGEDAGLGVPVVLLVVEGGYDAILDIRKSLKQRIPVVICEGTGRAADIIAYAFRHFITTRTGGRVMKDRHQHMLEEKLRAAFGKTWAQRGDETKETEKFMKIVTECCQDEKLITVFDMNRHEDLDLAILSALLKGQGAENPSQLRDQLKLAITWNRSDVAEEKIFNDQITWPTGFLDDIMTQALMEDKVNFVRLLLQNSVVMHEYLTVPMLRKLYNSAPKMSHLRDQLTRYAHYNPHCTVFLLQDVNRLLRKLLGKHTDEQYRTDNNVAEVMKNEDAYTGEEGKLYFQYPFRELFLWAVLMNRLELAKFLWERVDESIPSAIAASKIYDALANAVAKYDSELVLSYRQNKKEFEDLAIYVLEECQNTDPEKAAFLIERKYSSWGDLSCLQMAAAADDKEFLSTVCCQNSLNLMWRRGINSGWPKMMACLLFFPFIFFWLRFQRYGDKQLSLTAREKVVAFYRAPCVKFTANVLMYLVFLSVYSYMLLFEFRPVIRPLEILTLFWIGTFFVEEIREMLFSSHADHFTERIYDWWHFSFFNRLDLFVVIVAIIGVVFRVITFDGSFLISKTFYTINCVLFFIRLLRDYSASSYLGPKLVMITKMMKELLFYIGILLVFLLGYGISIHAVMFPVRDFYNGIFRDIFYYPTWQISGELYLEEIEGSSPDCSYVNGTKMKPHGELCPEFNALVPILTAAYLLMGNILLLNLLIAIFTNIFEEVETNSMQIWKYGMYFIVVEYETKPVLAPPFIIIEHIYRSFKYVVLNCCCRKMKSEPTISPRRAELLQVFEKEMTRSYIRKRELLRNKAMTEANVVKVLHSVNQITKLLEEEKQLETQNYEKNLSRENSSLDGSSSTGNLQSGGHSKPPIQNRFSRWPTLDKIRQLKDRLSAIREDSSDGGQGNYGYGSETGADSHIEDNIHRLDSQSENDMSKSYHRPKFVLDSETSQDDHSVPTPQSTGRVSKTQIPETSKQEEEEKTQEGGKRKSKKRKSRRKPKKSREGDHDEEDDLESSGGHRVRREYQKLFNASSDEDDEETIDGRSQKMSLRQRWSMQRQLSEVKELNIATEEGAAVSNAVSEVVVTRIDNIEHQLQELKEDTQRSLFNIEALLRNAVFSRAQNPAPPVSSPAVELSSFTPGNPYQAFEAFSPPRPQVSPPPYRRHMNFPQ